MTKPNIHVHYVHMILHITELRNQIFRIFKMVDAGEDVTIVKKDSNKFYKIVPVREDAAVNKETIAKQMGNIGFSGLPPKEIKRILETRYE